MMTSATARTSSEAADLRSQAIKCLSERCPFDDEETAPRFPTLPARVAAHLSDGRRKFKKAIAPAGAHGEQTPDVATAAPPPTPKQSKGSSMWDMMEVYFRLVNESDIGLLRPPPLPESCFFIPVVEKAVSFCGTGVRVKEELEVEKSEKVEEVKEEEGQPMEIDSVKDETSTLSVPEVVKEEQVEEEGEEGMSMNWIVGSKHRAILTTQRPTKKRKLLGSDAGLDQLLVLPRRELGCGVLCDVCCLGEFGGKSNKILSCGSCGALVHKKCYGVHGAVEEPWMCCWCRYIQGLPEDKRGKVRGLKPCLLCPREGGALKPVGGDCKNAGDKFAHLFCSLWTPEVYVEDTGTMEPVMNVGAVPEMRTRLVCNVCKVKHGVCVRCSYGTCRAAFHPICAREARHQMEIWGKLGCDNVELRGFCSKHSTCQDVGSVQCKRSLNKTTGDDFSVAKSPSAIMFPNKLPKLRLSRNTKDKNVSQVEVTSSGSKEAENSEATTEEDALAIDAFPEDGDIKPSKNIDMGVTEGDSSLPDISNLMPLIKQFICRGKISDAASALCISPDSLEAALTGEISSFPAELRLEITKWFQESKNMPTAMRHLKFRNGSTMSSGSLAARVDCPNAAELSGLDIAGSIKVSDHGSVDSCSDNTSSSPRRTKNTRILKEDEVIYPPGEKFQPSCDGELVDQIVQDAVVRTNDAKEDTTGSTSPIHDRNRCKDQASLGSLTEDACSLPNSVPRILPPELEGDPARVKNDILSEGHNEPECINSVLSKNLDNCETDGPVILQDDNVKKERTCESCSSSYVHPCIKKRIMQIQDDILLKQEGRESDLNGHSKGGILSAKASNSCNQNSCSSSCNEEDHKLGPRHLDQLVKAKQMGFLELSPEDEVEGEMLYLQNKLLDNAFVIKHSFENLLSRVVKKLPQELDTLKKQRWDLVLVNQFLHQVMEAKKRGRKERRHREAQAVLAAATAAASSSSRNPLLRKDGNNETGSLPQENPQKTANLHGRATVQPLLSSRLKETSRSTIVKASSEKHSGGLQFLEFSKDNALSCDICRRPETLLNRIFVCSSCKVAVHLGCYHKLKDPIGLWKCELCEEMSQSGSPRNQTVESKERSNLVVECGLCGGGSGAFRKATNGQWVHAFCAEWLLESTFKRGQQNPVDGMDVISKEKNLLTCSICQQKIGVCSKCSYGHCQVTFHPACARAAGFYMNVKTIGGRCHHKAYCEKHSVEQRQKADNQQYGAEELRSIKQIRFELEKVRILCERIVRREKIKRELVVCSHDILVSRRDHIALSTLVRSSFCTPGISSESATTSIDNKSYSGTVQRSEDITVDSTISGKRSIRFTQDMDRKTDDSSTSIPLFKRKVADRTSYSGKQLPHRTQSVSFRNSADDGEKRFKARKNTETVHNKVVMTSHQASMQNQRLPKGYAYVPINYLSKEKKLVVPDSESHEPEEPGG